MEILNDYSLQKNEDGCILVLFINPNETEFAREILDTTKEVSKDLRNWLMYFSMNLAPNMKIKTVRIMLGSLMLLSVPITSHAEDPNALSIESNQEYVQATKRFNMSYIYFGSPNLQKERVLRTNNSLQVVTPSYFDLNADGTLKLTPLLDTSFINEMHSNGIKVVPFLSNHWDRAKGIKALENRDNLVTEIITAIETYNLDGINVDIENVTHEQKDMYTDLVRQLRERLPSDKEVSVAVAANPNGWTKGWHGSYDYNELGKYADYLMIMAYDESYYGSLPGPVASHNFVERSIQYALQHVPPEKVVLGISFYGRYWNQELGIAGNGIHLTKIQELLDTYENNITYDDTYQAPKATITVKEGDPPVYVFGKPLAPGTYTVWYENNDSIKDKLLLVQKYSIKGTGSWSLGQELNDVWLYYNLWLNGQYFEDINQSWAKDDILTVAQRKIMTGITQTKFGPSDTLTRAQAATVFVRALNLEAINQSPKEFKDVPANHWAKKNIDIIVENGIMQGISHDTFLPDEPLTREQMAMLLYRVLEAQTLSSTEPNTFSDVESGRWSEEAINKTASLGVYKGYPDETFRPTKPTDRQEMATLINRIEDIKK